MNDSLNVSGMAGKTMQCECGHTHMIPIKSIQTGKGAVEGLCAMLAPFQGKTAYVVGDEITMALGYEKVLKQLKAAGIKAETYTFPCQGNTHPVTSEALIGAMLVRMPSKAEVIIAIGSGTMNDTARVVSARCRIPYVIVATAPSMDGYASSTSAVIMDGSKKSVALAHTPFGIIGDTDLIQTAPDVMLAAGAGDILGKYIALRDWRLASRETEEYYCPYIADMVLRTADRCAKSITSLFDREEITLKETMDSLVQAGIAICMYGTSRPAAGSEHQIAHHLEVEALRSGNNSLHGQYVGLSALIACRLYELASKAYDLPGGENMPSSKKMEGYLNQLKGYVSPEALMITPELMYHGILHAAEPEIRYSLASFLAQKGKIKEYAQRVTEEMLG